MDSFELCVKVILLDVILKAILQNSKLRPKIKFYLAAMKDSLLKILKYILINVNTHLVKLNLFHICHTLHDNINFYFICFSSFPEVFLTLLLKKLRDGCHHLPV